MDVGSHCWNVYYLLLLLTEGFIITVEVEAGLPAQFSSKCSGKGQTHYGSSVRATKSYRGQPRSLQRRSPKSPDTMAGWVCYALKLNNHINENWLCWILPRLFRHRKGLFRMTNAVLEADFCLKRAVQHAYNLRTATYWKLLSRWAYIYTYTHQCFIVWNFYNCFTNWLKLI